MVRRRYMVTAVVLALLSSPWWGGVWAQRGATGGEWPTYHGDLGATQYSALDQIDRDNVSRLALAWRWDSPDNALATENRRLRALSYKSTPLMVGGRLFINTSLGLVAALDAATGEELWLFDTDAKAAGRPTNLGFNSRGVAYWSDGEEARIFQPAGDAHLWAIDAKTGKPVADWGDGGKIDLTQGLRREVPRRSYTVVSAPLVVGDVVILGSSIFDGPTRMKMPPGDVRAFDVRTGKTVWTFHSIPQEGEYGNETWEEGSWKYTGNTNVWTHVSADPELDLVYLPFSTPTNDWYGGHRKGDNLFAESIVCVRAATGERVWHFQLVHHGLWDYDIPTAPTLFDLTVDGKPVKGLAVVTKQGFTYVFDRVTGEPVWPIEERPVPQSKAPGEQSAATQPFPTKPPPFEYQGISEDILIDFTPELRAQALKILEDFEWGPLFTPPVVSTKEKRGTIQLPGWGGGANWGGAALDPETGFLYVPSRTSPIVIGLMKPDASRSDFRYTAGGEGSRSLTGPEGLPLIKPPYGRITAIDLTRGEHAWMVPHGDGIRQRIIDKGLPDPGPVGGLGGTGPLLTKTLLFFGQGGRISRSRGATPSAGPVFRAFDKATGAVVHSLELPLPPSGTPMTYMAGGKQYIVVAGGGGTESGLMALALP